jgi:hypothetical protein
VGAELATTNARLRKTPDEPGILVLAGARQVGMDAVLIKAPDDPYPFTTRQETLEWQGPTITSLHELLNLVGHSPLF